VTATHGDGSVGLVLVHGSGHTSRTWDAVVAAVAHRAVAVELPGRRYRPADLTLATLERGAAATVEDVEVAGLDTVVLVGHSSGGLILPAVTRRLGPRVRHLVFVAGLIAPEGGLVADVFAGEGAPALAERRQALLDEHAGSTFGGLRPGEPPITTPLTVLDDARTVGAIESLSLILQPVRWAGVSADLPRTFVRCLRDPLQSRVVQARLIAGAGADEVIDLDCDHTPALSAPLELAAVLDEIASRHEPAQT
jgi:pimeloyl-ACP methyl ester carboxylesterase